MLKIGVQTHNIVTDDNPQQGFEALRSAGFSCVDFGLNHYLTNSDLYKGKLNTFFDQSVEQLRDYFASHVQEAKKAGITISQMHMPYPILIPTVEKAVNDYLCNTVALKSMEICTFFECPYIVVHGFKLTNVLGSEEAEWEKTEEFLDVLAPIAKDKKITICVENLYNSWDGHIIEGPCCNARKAVERIERFNEKYGAEVLGFCFDTGHANLVGIDMERFITKLGSHLKVLHIHDNDGVGDLHQIPFTFTKNRENKPSTDWEGFIRGLRNIQYQGVLSFETAPVLSAFPEELKEDALNMIARIGEYFVNEIEKGV